MLRTMLLISGVGVGWVGKIGNTMLSGDNLFETLMLNFVLYDRMRKTFLG